MKDIQKGKGLVTPVPLWSPGIGPLPVPPIVTDPNGSYTGRPVDPEERPVQDADDL